jgi:hypothetical protein
MSGTPAISVVLPTHNGSRYIDQAVESVVRQTFTDWELIVVNDASSDDTPAKIDAWTARDERIRAVHLAENRKLPGALNEGFRLAGGDYLSWTSDDNWYAPEALAKMLEVLQTRPRVDAAYAGMTEVDEAGSPVATRPVLAAEELAVTNVVGACFLYRRAVQDSLGGYREDLFLAEDYDFWLRAYLDFQLEPLDEALYFYRKHSGSLTEQRAAAIARATERAVEDWIKRTDRLSRKTRGRALEALGLRALVRGETRAGRRFLLRGICLLGRPPVFRRCRSYCIDFVLGKAAGDLTRRAWTRSEPL